MSSKLIKVKEAFVNEWGALGSSWGTNKTVAQVHATLLSESNAINTDEIMQKLHISRGNAHASLKELLSWGIVKKVVKKGDRKEYFAAEKDPWKVLCLIAKERRKKEIEPAMQVLTECIEELEGSNAPESQEFFKLLKELHEFIGVADRFMEKIGNAEKSTVMKLLMKMI